jgi:prolyl-tRNA synthetase
MKPALLKTRDDVVASLALHEIDFKEFPNPNPLTVEDLRKDPSQMEYSPLLKNLLYVDKKKNYYFLVAHQDTVISKGFWKSLGVSPSNVRLANDDQLQQVLHTNKGIVNLFALQNDGDSKIKTVIFDKKLEHCAYLSFHPQDNRVAMELRHEVVKQFLHKVGRTFEYRDLEIKDDEPEIGTDVQQSNLEKVGADVAKEDKGKPETKLKLEYKKAENFGEWYAQLIIKSGLLEYYDISGCYIYRPMAYFMWEKIQLHLDKDFKKLGVENCYFPMFVKKKNLESEKEHIEGFSAEVAWVTHSGNSQLAEPIAIRPTSETIMYPAFAKWIHSHRDLPLLLNQWTNVVRWEFKHPTPFIRSREFLWQEGHTVHSTKAESDRMVFDMLDIYANAYKDLLAIPVIKGIKSNYEKFAGADYTTTCETFVAENGRSIQACTSHSLGQNFAKIFDISFEDADMNKTFAWQTSWGFTTRSLGIVAMIHSDDQGLILPPKIAPTQVVIVPILFKDKNSEELIKRCREIKDSLTEAKVRVRLDDRENYTVGFKFNDWELKGVPIRLEVGPRDLQANEVKLVRRVDNGKMQIKAEKLIEDIKYQLKECHELMYMRPTTKSHPISRRHVHGANSWPN